MGSAAIDEVAVRWAYRLILGREPENEDIVRSIANTGSSVEQLRRAFLTSAEFQAASSPGAIYEGRFVSRAKTGPRLMVISNCQGPEIARHLATMTQCSVVGREINRFDKADLESWLRDCEAADHIFLIPLKHERFDGLTVEQMRGRFGDRVKLLGGVVFTGLQPDIVNLGEMNHRFDGPMVLHSGIALYGFMSGLSPKACAELYRQDVFQAFGYFEAWQASRAEFFAREAELDIRIGDAFFAAVRDIPLMLTQNHPTFPVYQMIAKAICEALGLPCRLAPAGYGATIQAYMPAWPVHDEIAERHRLTYRTSQMFVRENGAWDLPSLVASSFQQYRAYGRDRLAELLRLEAAKRIHVWLREDGSVVPPEEVLPRARGHRARGARADMAAAAS
jgi:hypothetical protein